MKKIRTIVYSLLTISGIMCMDADGRAARARGGAVDIPTVLRIELSKKTLSEYQDKFDTFVEKRKGQATTISRLNSVPFGLGKAARRFCR